MSGKNMGEEAYKAKHDEFIGILQALDSYKVNSKFQKPKGFYNRFKRIVMKISRETHNMPHYDTCQTCEDGWDMQIDFLIGELKRNSNHNKKDKNEMIK